MWGKYTPLNLLIEVKKYKYAPLFYRVRHLNLSREKYFRVKIHNLRWRPSNVNFAAIGSSSFGSSSIGSSKSTNQHMRYGITVIWQKRFCIIRTGISIRTGIRVALMYLFLWFHNGTGIRVDLSYLFIWFHNGTGISVHLSYLFIWFHHGTDIRLVSRCLSFCPKSVC